ncbi:MAG: aconitate hydratase, partial [Clostridium sp.]
LNNWVASKDIILELLRRLSVKGGVGRVFEYCGEGVKTLTVPERSTVTNMGAELGATTSVFPSDDKTLEFLKAQGREGDFTALCADDDAIYDEEVVIDLDALEPKIACPHSPDNVKNVSEVKGTKVNQILIGSCTNSSYLDLMKVANILDGKNVAEHVSLAIAPGSKQVLTMLSQNGALTKLVAAGARILESACGPCIGMGQSPATDAVSLRTFNRNFEGRSGTVSAGIYLVSPELAAASAITGYIEDPREVEANTVVEMPKQFVINDNLVVPPAEAGNNVEVVRGPNIKEFPKAKPLTEKVEGKVLTIVGDNITTDHIMPSNAKLLPFRSNIPFLSEHCLVPCDPEFPRKAKENNGGFILGGSNYGQGSSREHAALVPLYLGIKGVLAKSFARIHMANLINNGIMPLVFENEGDYDKISEGDNLVVNNAISQVDTGVIVVENTTKGESYKMILNVPERQKNMIKFGGLLNLTRSSLN